jgi:hypothetical protein
MDEITSHREMWQLIKYHTSIIQYWNNVFNRAFPNRKIELNRGVKKWARILKQIHKKSNGNMFRHIIRNDPRFSPSPEGYSWWRSPTFRQILNRLPFAKIAEAGTILTAVGLKHKKEINFNKISKGVAKAIKGLAAKIGGRNIAAAVGLQVAEWGFAPEETPEERTLKNVSVNKMIEELARSGEQVETLQEVLEQDFRLYREKVTQLNKRYLDTWKQYMTYAVDQHEYDLVQDFNSQAQLFEHLSEARNEGDPDY